MHVEACIDSNSEWSVPAWHGLGGFFMMGYICRLSVTGLDNAEVASSSLIVSIVMAEGQGFEAFAMRLL